MGVKRHVGGLDGTLAHSAVLVARLPRFAACAVSREYNVIGPAVVGFFVGLLVGLAVVGFAVVGFLVGAAVGGVGNCVGRAVSVMQRHATIRVLLQAVDAMFNQVGEADSTPPIWPFPVVTVNPVQVLAETLPSPFDPDQRWLLVSTTTPAASSVLARTVPVLLSMVDQVPIVISVFDLTIALGEKP